MTTYKTLGTYSISLLHYSLFYEDERKLVFHQPIRVHKGIECEYYFAEEDGKQFMATMRKKLEDPKFIYEFHAQHEKDWEALMRFIEEIIQEQPTEKLGELFEQYWHLLQQSQPLGDCFITVDNVYMEGTRQWVEQRLTALGRADEINHAMTILSWPWKNFETLEQEIEFYALAKKFKGKDVPTTFAEFREKIDEDLLLAFDKHLERWCWIPHWYDNEPFDEQFLLDQLHKALKEDVDARYDDLYNKTAEIKKEAEALVKDLQPDEKMQELIDGLREFTYFRTALDLHTSRALYYARPFYEQIAKALGVTFYDLKLLVAEEIIDFLKGNKDTALIKGLLAARKDMVIDMYEGDEQTVLVGEAAEKLYKDVLAKLEKEDTGTADSLTGVGASPGVAEGPARVITSVQEVSTVQEGDVLVVPSTSIDFLVAMKKAVAIVTEVGGLTSHAAIVSRELGIPCVVNTQVACEKLQTGQQIKVDGKAGTVEVV